MPYLVNHIHVKSKDPEKTANWFVEAFNVQIMSDTVRDFGDRFIVTQTEGGLAINISNERTVRLWGPATRRPTSASSTSVSTRMTWTQIWPV